MLIHLKIENIALIEIIEINFEKGLNIITGDSGSGKSLILDSLTLDSNFTQIPGLILCGFWFGRIKLHNDILIGHFRYGLICSFGSFLCGTLNFLQILFKNFSDTTFLLFIPSIQNILAEVFLTGFFAPLICSQLVRMFKFSKKKVQL